jgi:hypothetical protein
MRLAAQLVGKQVKCPHCGSAFTAQAAPALAATSPAVTPKRQAAPPPVPPAPAPAASRPTTAPKRGTPAYLFLPALGCLALPLVALLLRWIVGGAFAMWVGVVLGVFFAVACVVLAFVRPVPAILRFLVSGAATAFAYFIVAVAFYFFHGGPASETAPSSATAEASPKVKEADKGRSEEAARPEQQPQQQPASGREAAAEVDMSRLILPTPYGWKATYDQAKKSWTYESPRPPDQTIRVTIDEMPRDIPATLDAFAAKVAEKGFLEPGQRYTEVKTREELPDGFCITGVVEDDMDKSGKPSPGLAMVRTINGATIRCHSTRVTHDYLVKEAIDFLKKAVIFTSPHFALPAPTGWVMTPDNRTLIVSLASQAQLAYFDTVANKELKRIEVDFQPGPLAIQGDTLFAAAKGSARVYALDLQTAKVKKEFSVGGDAVDHLACHPSKGLLYASTTAFTVSSINPDTGEVTKTAAKGYFLAVDPVKGEFVYTGIQPPLNRDEFVIEEGPNGMIRIFSDRWGKRSMLMKYAVAGADLRFVAGQNNAAVNGWVLCLTADGKRVMMLGGGGWRPTREGGTGGGYVVAVYDTADLTTMLGQAPHGQNIAFHPVLNLGVTNHDGMHLTLFNGKSFKVKKVVDGPSKTGGAGRELLTFGGRGRKLIFWNGENFKQGQGLHFVPLDLTDDDRAALEAAYGKP